MTSNLTAQHWVGFDLDGVLATYTGTLEIGPPIPAMIKLLRHHIAEGTAVKIVTARVAASGLTSWHGVVDDQAFADSQRAAIDEWCQKYIGHTLPVTASKDLYMTMLYDDRCVCVETNTGRIIGKPTAIFHL